MAAPFYLFWVVLQGEKQAFDSEELSIQEIK